MDRINRKESDESQESGNRGAYVTEMPVEDLDDITVKDVKVDFVIPTPEQIAARRKKERLDHFWQTYKLKNSEIAVEKAELSLNNIDNDQKKNRKMIDAGRKIINEKSQYLQKTED